MHKRHISYWGNIEPFAQKYAKHLDGWLCEPAKY